MKNHLYSNIASLCILGGFVFIAQGTIEPCFEKKWTADRCEKISPVNTQYHITVQVRDKITQQPIPDVTVTCKLQYYNAVVNLDNNTCKQESVDYQHLYQVTNAAGMAAFTANSFAMDSKGDEVFIQVEVVSSKYAANQASDVRFYNGASEVQFPVLLLDREAL